MPAKHCWYKVKDDGYSVYVGYVHTGEIEEEYHAGNSLWDSAQYLPVGHPQAVDNATLREWAKKNAEEMADGHQAQNLGEVD